MFSVAQEIMHQVALVPMVVMLVTWRTTPFHLRQWILAAALMVSWVMDSTDFLLMSEGSAQIIMRYGMPVQVALALGAVVRDRRTLGYLLAGLVVVASTSALQGIPTRELMVPVVGGFVVALYAWDKRDETLERGVLVYFGVGALAWAAWSVAATAPTTTALVAWSGYQLTRLVGILLITAALVLYARKPRLELI